MTQAGAEQPGGSRRSWPSLPRLPLLPVVLAAAITGLVCGLLATLLVWGGERGCDAVRGRPSCGGYGLVMLVAIFVACFLLGVGLLRAFDVDDAGVVTFFGLGLPMFVILAFLIDSVFDTWLAYALPVMVACFFVASVYIARGLAAANPSPHADRQAEPDDTLDDDDAGRAGDPGNPPGDTAET